MSLSARRAWIEILIQYASSVDVSGVALRKESVDRNNRRFTTVHNTQMSLSARRAWIEIAQGWRVSGRTLVALRKESVDRN